MLFLLIDFHSVGKTSKYFFYNFYQMVPFSGLWFKTNTGFIPVLLLRIIEPITWCVCVCVLCVYVCWYGSQGVCMCACGCACGCVVCCNISEINSTVNHKSALCLQRSFAASNREMWFCTQTDINLKFVT